jgi:hypothetical protein
VQWFLPIILRTREEEIRRITVQSQTGQTAKLHLNLKKNGCDGVYLSSHQETQNRRITVQAGPSIKARPYSKKPKELVVWLK